MASKTKAEFVVVKPITLHSRTRARGFVFTACADGVHVTRWIADGKIQKRRTK